MKESENKKIDAALDRAAQLLNENGLIDWKAKVAGRAPTLAEAFYRTKTIHFTKAFILKATKEQFDCVTLHEVAHAILGPGVGHNSKFVELCNRISPDASYSNQFVAIPLRKYIFTCPECGHTGSNSNLKEIYCARCFRDKKKQVKFNIVRNNQAVIAW